MPADPRVTVCVSTRDRSHLLKRLLGHLERQTLGIGSFEVVVVDDGSSEAGWRVLQDVAASSPLQLTVLRNEVSQGPACGRNRAWRHGSGPVIAFTDDDCRPTPTWLEEGLRAVAGGTHHVAGTAVPAPEDWDRVGPFSRYLVADRFNGRWFAAANLFVPRSSLEAVGGFDEGFRRASGEDTDLGLRLEAWGSPFVFAERAVVHHDVSTTRVGQVIRDQARWEDLVGVIKRHPHARQEFLTHRYFWKPNHLRLMLLLLGLLSRRAPVAAVLAAPWLHARTCTEGAEQASERLATLPGMLALDAAEMIAMARGSLRHRTLVL